MTSFYSLSPREQRGSRDRCILLTTGTREEVAARLNRLFQPSASVSPDGHWMPQGVGATREARLGEAEGFLSPERREEVLRWWLAVRHRANTPNWDLAATATIAGRPGLVLVEAKAHVGELSSAGQGASDSRNRTSIAGAVGDAGVALTALQPGWALSATSHYQLANRFAWAWKVASLGVPVVLVYLGFLNAREMEGRRLFGSAEEWERAVRDHARGVVPEHVWDAQLSVGGTPLIAMIRSAEVRLPA